MGIYDLANAGETHVVSGTANFTSPVASLGKSLVMDGGVADFSSGVSVAVPEFGLSNGTLTGVGDLTATNTLNWTGGTMSGSGSTTVAAGAAFNLSGMLDLESRTLDNAGSATWSGDGQYDDFQVINSATIDNQAVRHLRNHESSDPGLGRGQDTSVVQQRRPARQEGRRRRD